MENTLYPLVREENLLKEVLEAEGKSVRKIEEEMGIDEKKGTKYVVIIQVVTCIVIIAAFLIIKFGFPEVFEAVKNWYLDLIEKQIPANYIEEFFGSLFG
jgi:hypothetical protein